MNQQHSKKGYNKFQEKKYLTTGNKIYINFISAVFGIVVYIFVFILLELLTKEGGGLIGKGMIYLILFLLIPIFGGFHFSKKYLTKYTIKKNMDENINRIVGS